MLESIGGIATRDMPLAYAEILLQGDPGTSVEITALRVRKPEPQKITLLPRGDALSGSDFQAAA